MTSAEDLLRLAAAPRTEPVTLPVSGAVVLVRGLTRAEVLANLQLEGADAQERASLARGLVEPALTPEQCSVFYDGAPAPDSMAVINKILALTFGTKESAKAALKSDVHGPAAEGGPLPSAGAGDEPDADTGAAA